MFQSVLFLFRLLPLASGCIYQTCMCEYGSIYCQNRGLTSIPPIIGTNTGGFPDVDFSTNNITQVKAGSLPPGIEYLFFLQNPILTVDDAAFDTSANTLQDIYFSEAYFTGIPEAFSHLKTLKNLKITDTHILNWNGEVMAALGQHLKSLVLENVGFTSWPNWITSFSNLTELSFSENSLSFIPDNAFDHLANTLTTLSLFNNQLTSVPKAMSNLKALTSLKLQVNKIRDVIWLPQSAKLSMLILFNNSLRDAGELSDSLRNYGDSLTVIDIHGNQLTAIPNISFLAQVEALDFSDNLMSGSNAGSVPPNINTLNLAHNSLSSIPLFMTSLDLISEMLLSWNAITRITSTDFSNTITGVDLQYNLLSELSDDSFPKDSNIASLLLSGNPLVRISRLALSTLPHLMDLNLRSTKLTRLPLAMGSLTTVGFVDLTNNPSLVCTCVEKDLESWVATLSAETIVGNCGQTSIYDFFIVLSPSCP